MDYKNTLNLPQTGFPMKADLVAREPQRLQKWHTDRLYERIQRARANAERFILHDGPPFANGDVHIGTALNKILKDFVVRYHSLRGKNAPYVPGWDCHGLPIEFKVTQEMRKAGNTSADPAAIRTACDAYARKYIDLQRAQFKRLGILGDWDNPYLTLNKEYEADELRLFADIVEKGFVYRGKKPVYWSIPARTGRLYPGDAFVESSTGTGFVHIAPGHGLEDYALGLRHGLPIYSPVNDDGCFAITNDLPPEQQMPAEMVGKSILEKHGKSDA